MMTINYHTPSPFSIRYTIAEMKAYRHPETAVDTYKIFVTVSNETADTSEVADVRLEVEVTQAQFKEMYLGQKFGMFPLNRGDIPIAFPVPIQPPYQPPYLPGTPHWLAGGVVPLKIT